MVASMEKKRRYKEKRGTSSCSRISRESFLKLKHAQAQPGAPRQGHHPTATHGAATRARHDVRRLQLRVPQGVLSRFGLLRD